MKLLLSLRWTAWTAASLLLIGGCSQEPEPVNPDPPPFDVDVSDSELAAPSTRKSKEQLREQAKTDPDGADSEAIDKMSRNEVVATAINSAGFLCARVTDMYPSGGAIVVNCVENRNGSGRVKYRVDANAGRVEEID